MTLNLEDCVAGLQREIDRSETIHDRLAIEDRLMELIHRVKSKEPSKPNPPDNGYSAHRSSAHQSSEVRDHAGDPIPPPNLGIYNPPWALPTRPDFPNPLGAFGGHARTYTGNAPTQTLARAPPVTSGAPVPSLAIGFKALNTNAEAAAANGPSLVYMVSGEQDPKFSKTPTSLEQAAEGTWFSQHLSSQTAY